MRALALVLLFFAFPLTGALGQGDPCAPNPCTAPPPDQCLNSSTLQHYEQPGTCVDVGGSPACSYDPVVIDCSASGGSCAGGQCVSAVPWLQDWGVALVAGLLIATAAFALRRRQTTTPGP